MSVDPYSHFLRCPSRPYIFSEIRTNIHWQSNRNNPPDSRNEFKRFSEEYCFIELGNGEKPFDDVTLSIDQIRNTMECTSSAELGENIEDLGMREDDDRKFAVDFSCFAYLGFRSSIFNSCLLTNWRSVHYEQLVSLSVAIWRTKHFHFLVSSTEVCVAAPLGEFSDEQYLFSFMDCLSNHSIIHFAYCSVQFSVSLWKCREMIKYIDEFQIFWAFVIFIWLREWLKFLGRLDLSNNEHSVRFWWTRAILGNHFKKSV